MKAEQYDFISNSYVDLPPPKIEGEERYKYLAIDVERMQSIEIFLRVPEDFDVKNIKRSDIHDILDEQDVSDFEWETDDVYGYSVRNSDEKEANRYGYSEFPFS